MSDYLIIKRTDLAEWRERFIQNPNYLVAADSIERLALPHSEFANELSGELNFELEDYE